MGSPLKSKFGSNRRLDVYTSIGEIPKIALNDLAHGMDIKLEKIVNDDEGMILIKFISFLLGNYKFNL